MGYNEMKRRMGYNDATAQDRMIIQKQKTLKDNIARSYFGFSVTKPDIDDEKIYRVLITGVSNSLGDSETKKDISSFFEDGFKVGSIVHWLKTKSYWIIYEQEKSEIAYFQGKMIEAKNYQIITLDGKYSTWGSLSLSLAEGEEMFNETLLTYEETRMVLRIPDSVQNREVFGLDKKIRVLDTVWKIYNIDYISDPGIITIRGKRSFDSDIDVSIEEDNIVDNDNTYIDGPNIIAPFEKAVYTIKQGVNGAWSIPDNPNILKTINNDNSLTIIWNNARKRNDFTIAYGEHVKHIQVESLM